MMASSAPTSTVSSAWTLMVFRTPATGEGTSVSTLSVDTSNRGSSASTRSPSCLIQRVMVPSVIDSPSSGILTGVAIDDRLPAQIWWKRRPARVRWASPTASDRVGWGWMYWATSIGRASQL